MAIEDLWYENAIIYCLPVEKYMGSNDDGVGDFEGLSRRLPYLAGLGVTCLWLQPFFASPNRDNSYDVSDYYGVCPKYGSLGDFVEFTNHAKSLGLRVLVDLVVNHTSAAHPWFRSARRGPKSPFHDWYVWSDRRPRNYRDGVVFPGVQKTTWTYDRQARRTTRWTGSPCDCRPHAYAGAGPRLRRGARGPCSGRTPGLKSCLFKGRCPENEAA